MEVTYGQALDRYCELCREGEALNLKFSALGLYIARRLTNAELIALARHWDHLKQRNGGSTHDEPAQQRLL